MEKAMLNSADRKKMMEDYNYKMIRGPKQKARCKKVGPYGSALYCDCGCQSPNVNDPKINLTDVVMGKQSTQPGEYAESELVKNGTVIGWVNTQYCAFTIHEHEYLGIPREVINRLIAISSKAGKIQSSVGAGDSLIETSANVHLAEKIELAEQDARHENHLGYCNQCHGFCYGDCQANI